MRTRLLYYWHSLRTSYWFVPTMMSVLAFVSAVAMIAVDRQIQKGPISADVWWVYGGGPEGARAVMSTIAGSMITVAGTVFSITIVALSLASGQFGPRLLRNFMRDRSNQFVLGTFTATFVYCLLVLRTIHGTDSGRFVPGAAVAGGIILALASLGVLIYFIHHVAISIQANQVIAAVSREMRETIERLWPDELGHGPTKEDVDPDAPDDAVELPEGFERDAMPVYATGHGYVAAIDEEGLMQLAKKYELVIRLTQRAGHFVIEGTPLVCLMPADKLDDELSRKVNEIFLLETQRTPYQDLEFTVDQLVEVAVRALSPGINDPFTAIICLDWLAEALGRLARRSIPLPYRYDEDGNLRVITRGVSFSDVCDAAFNQIRQYGSSSPAVMIHLLDNLANVAHVVRRPDDRTALIRHARLVSSACERDVPDPTDRIDVEMRLARVFEILGVMGQGDDQKRAEDDESPCR